MPQEPRIARHPARQQKQGLNEVEAADLQREEAVKLAEQNYRDLVQKAYGDRMPHATPWLHMRCNPLHPPDIGLRPLAYGEVFWASPDITVESSDPLGNPVAGQENFVHARIFNLGRFPAAPVQVDFWWGNPSLGLGQANLVFIGTEWVERPIPHLQHADVRCRNAWIPVFVNGGHECLMVNCNNHILDPILQPFQPQLDRHVGQRNVHVLPATPGEKLPFALELGNLFPLPARTTITARIEYVLPTRAAHPLAFGELLNHIVAYGALETNAPLEMRRRFRQRAAEHRTARQIAELASSRRATETQFVRGLYEAGDPIYGAATVTIQLLPRRSTVKPSEPGQLLANLLLAADKLTDSEPGFDARREVLLHEVTLKPFELRYLELELAVPPGAKPSEYVVFHLAQRAEGLAIGGYTIVVQVVKERKEIHG